MVSFTKKVKNEKAITKKYYKKKSKKKNTQKGGILGFLDFLIRLPITKMDKPFKSKPVEKYQMTNGSIFRKILDNGNVILITILNITQDQIVEYKVEYQISIYQNKKEPYKTVREEQHILPPVETSNASFCKYTHYGSSNYNTSNTVIDDFYDENDEFNNDKYRHIASLKKVRSILKNRIKARIYNRNIQKQIANGAQEPLKTSTSKLSEACSDLSNLESFVKKYEKILNSMKKEEIVKIFNSIQGDCDKIEKIYINENNINYHCQHLQSVFNMTPSEEKILQEGCDTKFIILDRDKEKDVIYYCPLYMTDMIDFLYQNRFIKIS